VGQACENASARQVARQFRLAASTVRAIDLRYLQRWNATRRKAPLEQMGVGHRVVDQVAGFLESLPLGPVTRDESRSMVRDALDLTGPLPELGTDPAALLEQTAQFLFAHSLFNAHPRFFGYITAAPAPIGILGDFLAAAVNPNVGAWTLSPAATEIEAQTVRWIAELINYPVNCGGLLLSGGKMANLVCFLAARAATPEALRAAFAYHPPYYHFEERVTNYVDYGPQNSRGFRALKVWLALKHAGAEGYRNMIADDIRLSQTMAQAVSRHADLQLMAQGLSITTFRYVPRDLRTKLTEPQVELHLDALNREVVDRLQRGSETLVSNAVVGGHYVLRACIVNFHTTQTDVEAVPDIVVRIGREVEAELRLRNSQPE
jgi:glutamate/tyrosine decarboxylase-like PLP-dependent enzyme